jgi:hypothetical protein
MSATLPQVANPRLVRALLRRDGAAVRAALSSSMLLVPARENRDGDAVVDTRRGAGGRRLVCAFTDLEALQAWDRSPSGCAVALDARAVAALVSGAIVALNPAGPGAHLINGLALGKGRQAASDLTDPARRRPLRRQANQFHELARRSAAAGAFAEACEQLEPALNACAELGDCLHGAAAALELAAWRARSGSTRLALAGWSEAAETMAALGELDLALDALLEAAQAAADAGLAAEAEDLSVTALDLAAGSDFSDRLIGLWKRLAGGGDDNRRAS